jgi:hypothetical protein
LFKISKLNTSPNPGTKVLPTGTCVDGVVVVCVVSCVVVSIVVLVAVVVAVSCGIASAGGGCSSCCGGDCEAGGALIGLTGFTGLAIFVGFVALLTQVFAVSTQGFTVG